MVSAKMYELGTKKSTIRTIFEFGRKRAAEVGEENIFDFSLGNPNVPTPDFVRDAAVDILQTSEPSAVHGYTCFSGEYQQAIRHALCREKYFRDERRGGGDNDLFQSPCRAGRRVHNFCAVLPRIQSFRRVGRRGIKSGQAAPRRLAD